VLVVASSLVSSSAARVTARTRGVREAVIKLSRRCTSDLKAGDFDVERLKKHGMFGTGYIGIEGLNYIPCRHGDVF